MTKEGAIHGMAVGLKCKQTANPEIGIQHLLASDRKGDHISSMLKKAFKEAVKI